MKATELINKFKQILTLSTEEVIDEATTVEETVELNEEVAPEVDNVEVNESEEVSEEVVEETEEATEEVVEEVEENNEEVEEGVDHIADVNNVNEERVIEKDSTDYNLAEETTEEEVTELAEETTEEVIETELAEEGDNTEEVVEDIQEVKEEIKYASAEELAGLKAEIAALGEMLNNLNPKKDVPQELSAEDIKEEQDTAEGISVSPEADVVEQPRPLAVKSGLKNASTKDVVWNKLFGN